MNRKQLTLKEKEDEILVEVLGVVRFYRYWINDPTYFNVMKTVDKMLKYMDLEEALNCAIQKWMFLIWHKIDDTSIEEAGGGVGEESRSSNLSKNDSCNPGGGDKRLAFWSEINDVMESRGLTLKQTEKTFIKIFVNIVKLCKEWEKDPTYARVMKTVKNVEVKKDMDFPEALCYGIEQRKFLLWRNIAMDDDTSAEAAVTEEDVKIQNEVAVIEEDIKMEPIIKKPRWSDPIYYLWNCR